MRTGKEGDGMRLRHTQLEVPDSQAETSTWHCRLGLELQKTDMGWVLYSPTCAERESAFDSRGCRATVIPKRWSNTHAEIFCFV